MADTPKCCTPLYEYQTKLYTLPYILIRLHTPPGIPNEVVSLLMYAWKGVQQNISLETSNQISGLHTGVWDKTQY